MSFVTLWLDLQFFALFTWPTISLRSESFLKYRALFRTQATLLCHCTNPQHFHCCLVLFLCEWLAMKVGHKFLWPNFCPWIQKCTFSQRCLSKPYWWCPFRLLVIRLCQLGVHTFGLCLFGMQNRGSAFRRRLNQILTQHRICKSFGTIFGKNSSFRPILPWNSPFEPYLENPGAPWRTHLSLWCHITYHRHFSEKNISETPWGFECKMAKKCDSWVGSKPKPFLNPSKFFFFESQIPCICPFPAELIAFGLSVWKSLEDYWHVVLEHTKSLCPQKLRADDHSRFRYNLQFLAPLQNLALPDPVLCFGLWLVRKEDLNFGLIRFRSEPIAPHSQLFLPYWIWIANLLCQFVCHLKLCLQFFQKLFGQLLRKGIFALAFFKIQDSGSWMLDRKT